MPCLGVYTRERLAVDLQELSKNTPHPVIWASAVYSGCPYLVVVVKVAEAIPDAIGETIVSCRRAGARDFGEGHGRTSAGAAIT